MKRLKWAAWVAAAAMLLQGCHGNVKEKQLQRVAKDWSQVIRASQIIPVYPLHEDLLPGDAFLVQTTVDNQQSLYKKKGFLPLDPPMARIRPSGYQAFYSDFKLLPGCVAPPLAGEVMNEIDVRTLLNNPACLARLPNVAFPSYSFEVGGENSFNAALPLQALSLGLNLTNSRRAHGSVAMREAYTFGVDVQSLLGDVRAWNAADPTLLKPYRATQKRNGRYVPRAYLRVVNRVFLVQVMDVRFESLEKSGVDARAQPTVPGLGFGGITNTAIGSVDQTLVAAQKLGATNCQLAGGNPVRRLLPGVLDKLPTSTNSNVLCQLPPNVIEQVRSKLPPDALRALGTTLDQAVSTGVAPNLLSSLLPQLRVQATSMSQGAVSLSERFNRPLAVGYLAFDIPIDENGGLGAAIPSYAVLERQTVSETESVRIDEKGSALVQLLEDLSEHDQPYIAATETLRCVSLAIRQPQLLLDWQGKKLVDATPTKIRNGLKAQLNAVIEARFPVLQINKFLEKALDGKPAC